MMKVLKFCLLIVLVPIGLAIATVLMACSSSKN
jgi:hypothetical protein